MKRVILYARKSTEQEDRQMLSIPAQLRELRAYADREHLEIVASLSEAQTAGKTGRPQFGRMLEMLDAKEADAILAWHPDRLARNAIDGAKIIHLLDIGVLKHLYFPTMQFENSPQGKFFLTLTFGQSKLYVDSLSENVKRGQREKVIRGEWTWPAPLGYRNNRETRNIEPDPKTAPLIRKAFELYATSSYTFLALRDELHNLGLRTRKGKKLPMSNLQRMLRYGVYCGMIEFNGEQFEGSFDAIVSKHLFDDVQQVLKQRSRPKKRRCRHHFPFIGWLKCSECECSITAEIQKGHHYYHCTKKRGNCTIRTYAREETILAEARRIVEELTLPDDWYGKMLTKLDEEESKEQSDNRESVQRLQNELEDTESKIDALLDLRLDGALDNDEYIGKKNKLISQKVLLAEKIEKAKQNHSDWLEPMRDAISRSQQAKELLSADEAEAFPAFLHSVGSNFLWNGTAVRYEATKTGAALAAARKSRTWWRGLYDVRTEVTETFERMQSALSLIQTGVLA